MPKPHHCVSLFIMGEFFPQRPCSIDHGLKPGHMETSGCKEGSETTNLTFSAFSPHLTSCPDEGEIANGQ